MSRSDSQSNTAGGAPARTALLVAAAGLSSRMGAFKPLIELDGKALIEHTLDTFSTAGIDRTVVVTGHRAQDIEARLAGRDITFLRNGSYRDTHMLDSIKLGLEWLEGKCDRLFFMPADIPLVKPFTIRQMLARGETDTVLKPSWRGENGHPLLIGADCIPAMLSYGGTDGLRGAIQCSGMGVEILPLPDPALLLDADTPQALEGLRAYYSGMDVPGRTLALELLRWRQAGEDIEGHCIAVADLAVALGRIAIRKGYAIEPTLVEAGALLHDIERAAGRGHAGAGAALLREMGYPRVAAIVETHMDLPAGETGTVDERAIVYLADKLTRGQERVRPDERMARMIQAHAGDEAAIRTIRTRMERAMEIMARLEISIESCMDL